MLLGATAVVLAACTPAPPPEPLEPGPAEVGLRVMTYNLLGAQADANVVSEHAGWVARVGQLQPDVLVLQEAQSDDVAALVFGPEPDYRLASWVPWACDVKPSREGVAILVAPTVDLLGGGGTHVGDMCVDPSVRRPVAWADLDLPTGPLRVYGTHLTAGGGSGAASRDLQIRRLRALIAEHDPEGEGRWLLAGDLNTHPGEASHRLVLDGDADMPDEQPFVDTFAELQPDAADPSVCPAVSAGDAVGMAFLLANPEHVRRCGYTAGWPKDSNWLACDLLSLCVSWEQRRETSVRVRIDYVVRAADGPVETLAAFVPNRADPGWAAPGAEWYRLSDHLPVVVDVEVG